MGSLLGASSLAAVAALVAVLVGGGLPTPASDVNERVLCGVGSWAGFMEGCEVASAVPGGVVQDVPPVEVAQLPPILRPRVPSGWARQDWCVRQTNGAVKCQYAITREGLRALVRTGELGFNATWPLLCPVLLAAMGIPPVVASKAACGAAQGVGNLLLEAGRSRIEGELKIYVQHRPKFKILRIYYKSQPPRLPPGRGPV